MEIEVKNRKKNKFGQYFTPKIIAEFMINLADISKNSNILEPACGEGIFLELFQDKGFQNLIAFEIDKDLATNFSCVRYESFVSAKIEEQFDLIIGNPPYIRWKNLEEELKEELSYNPLWNKYFNSLCDYSYLFILKSIELLKENGQLIFICPEYWMNTTHSLTLRNYMVKNGYFESIYHFNETPIFDKVTVSIVIFKFIKSKINNKQINVVKYYAKKKLNHDILNSLKNNEKIKDVEYFNISQFSSNERWLLTNDNLKKEIKSLELSCQKKTQNTLSQLFQSEKHKYHTIKDYCDIGNGLVSGLDKAFQLNGCKTNEYESKSILKVIKAKDISPFYAHNITKYIFIKEGLNEKEVSELFPNFYKQLLIFKNELENRYQYNREINFLEWVFLRNFKLFNKKEKRIFVPCKERISNKDFFRFSLIDENIFPTQDVTAIFKKSTTKESLEYIVAYLNNERVFNWLKFNGIVKGNIVEFSEKPIASIPFRAINWNNEYEVKIHDYISQLTIQYIDSKNDLYLAEINNSFNNLFDK